MLLVATFFLVIHIIDKRLLAHIIAVASAAQDAFNAINVKAVVAHLAVIIAHRIEGICVARVLLQRIAVNGECLLLVAEYLVCFGKQGYKSRIVGAVGHKLLCNRYCSILVAHYSADAVFMHIDLFRRTLYRLVLVECLKSFLILTLLGVICSKEHIDIAFVGEDASYLLVGLQRLVGTTHIFEQLHQRHVELIVVGVEGDYLLEHRKRPLLLPYILVYVGKFKEYCR